MNPRIYVYKITFLENKYYYYGIHKERFYEEPYMGSPVTYKSFWKKYTPIKNIIKIFPNSKEGWIEAINFEKELIKKVFKKDALCLNMNCAGAINFTDEIKNKISKANSGRKASEELKIKFSLSRRKEKNGMWGRKHSKKSIELMKQKAIGRRHSEESKKKISEAFKGENHPLFGIGHTDESKKKMSESKIGMYKGNKNPRYKPKNWIHDEYGERNNYAVFDLVNEFPELNKNKLYSVSNGRKKQYKGWKLA